MSFGGEGLVVRLGARTALDGVSVAVPEGAVTCVIGGDGAGKSTLLRVLAGAIDPDAGRPRRPPADRIGFLPTGSGLYPDLSLEENLAFSAGAYGLSSGERRQREIDLLERTGLAPFGRRLAGQLSGGMRQKLAVVRAMLHRPLMLVLDEPTTGVDPVSRADLWWLITRAAAEGAAVVLSTTYVEEAQRASSILVLGAGRSLAAGSPAGILAATPGTIRLSASPPASSGAGACWRRGRTWRTWSPEPPSVPAAASKEAYHPDLRDAVTIAEVLADGAGPAGTPRTAPCAPSGRTAGAGGDASNAGAGGPMRLLACARGVSMSFGSFLALDGVDLGVERGEIVGLLGANGAGKTTLVRLLVGVLAPSGGSVRLFGESPSRRVRARIGYVPQALGLYGDLTPAENLAFSRAVYGTIAVAGAGAHPGGPTVDEMPLGLQRRTAFAQALDHRPELLVLDEPTSGTGPLMSARLWETIRTATDAGAGALVTTHNLEEAEQCDRLVVMAEGRVVATGTVDQIVGEGLSVLVQAREWVTAFDALQGAGMPAALVGSSLRVPGRSAQEVVRALAGHEVQVSEVPMSLEERFVQLAGTVPPAGGPAPGAAGARPVYGTGS